MTPSTPTLPTRQQLIDLLSQHKQEWRRLYGIQAITLFGSLARDEATSRSDVDLCVILEPPNPLALVHFREAIQNPVGRLVDVVTRWPGLNPALQREIERDAVSI